MSQIGQARNAHRNFVRKPEGIKPFGTPRRTRGLILKLTDP